MNDVLTELVPRVFRFALRLTRDRNQAEDIAQETFLRAWRRKQRLRDPAALRTWLFRIAVNVYRDELRRGQLRRERLGRRLEVQHADEEAGHADSPQLRSIEQEEAAWVLRELELLPRRQRQVLYLSAVEELTNLQIAEVLDLGAGAVKANLSVARRKLREKLAKRNARL